MSPPVAVHCLGGVLCWRGGSLTLHPGLLQTADSPLIPREDAAAAAAAAAASASAAADGGGNTAAEQKETKQMTAVMRGNNERTNSLHIVLTMWKSFQIQANE